MTWVIYSFLTAIVNATLFTATKKLTNKLDEFSIALSTALFTGAISAIFLIAYYLTYFHNINNIVLKSYFFPITTINVILGSVATLILLKGISSEEISKTIPFISFTPIFSMLIEFLIYKKLPNTAGIIGILLVVSGSYLINLKTHMKNLLEPFSLIVKNKGSLFIVLTALIWSITSVLDKVATRASSPAIYTGIFSILRFPILVLIFLLFTKYTKYELNIDTPYKLTDINNKIKSSGLILVIIMLSVLHFIESIFQNIALTTGLVSFVIAIKRTSILITILLGIIALKEQVKAKTVLAASLMVIGVVLIILF